jgi:hypothetical protein
MSRFFQREDGAWCEHGETRPDPLSNKRRLPPEPIPLEWDDVSLRRCLERHKVAVTADTLKQIEEEYWARVANGILLGGQPT